MTVMFRLKFLFKICANCGAIAVIANMTYMTLGELFDEWPDPSSHEMIIIIDHDNSVYIE